MEKETVNNSKTTEEPIKTEPSKKEAPAPKERINLENTAIIALVLSILALWAVKWSLIINWVTVAFIVYKFFM